MTQYAELLIVHAGRDRLGSEVVEAHTRGPTGMVSFQVGRGLDREQAQERALARVVRARTRVMVMRILHTMAPALVAEGHDSDPLCDYLHRRRMRLEELIQRACRRG